MEIYKELNTSAAQEFEKLLNSQLSKNKIEEGKIIDGVVTKITEKFVFLFIDGLKSTGVNFEVVNNQEAFANDVATQVGTDMLIANPEINLMYAANEGGTIGAVNAVLAAGQIGQTYVMGTDATAELMNFVSDGEILLAVNSQFPRDMGAGAMRAALKAVNGEKVDEYVQLTPTKVFTSIDKIAIDTWLSERGYD